MSGVRRDGGKLAHDCDHKKTQRWFFFSCLMFGATSLGGIKERLCVTPNLNMIQKQNKPQIRLNTWLEPKWALSPWDISHEKNQRVHQWGNTADFIIYSLPGQLEGEPKLGKSPELMDSLNWSARKVKLLPQTFPSTLGQSVKDILSVFISAHLWCSGGYHSDGMSLAGRGFNYCNLKLNKWGWFLEIPSLQHFDVPVTFVFYIPDICVVYAKIFLFLLVSNSSPLQHTEYSQFTH